MYITRNTMGLTFIPCVTDTVVYAVSIEHCKLYRLRYFTLRAWSLVSGERDAVVMCDADGYPLP